MRRLFQRLTWQNRTIAQKSIIISLAAVMVFLLLAVIGFNSIEQIQEGQITVINNSTEIVRYSQEIQGEIDTLERISNKIYEIVSTNTYEDFTQITIVLPQQYENAVQSINDSIAALRETSSRVLTSDPVKNPLLAETNQLLSTLALLEPEYQIFISNAKDLADPAAGYLSQTRRVGDELESVTTSQAALPEQVAQILYIRGIESYMLRGGGADQIQPLQEAATTFATMHEEYPFPINHPEEITDLISQYFLVTEETGLLIDRFNNADQLMRITLSVLRDDASRVNTTARSITASTTDIITQRNRSLQNTITAANIVAALLTGVVIFTLSRTIIRRTRVVASQVDELEAGHLDYVNTLTGYDEFSSIALKLETVREQLRMLTQNLDERIAQNTRDLSFSAEIGRLALEITNTQALMNTLVESIRERFDFYHAQVFLLDESGENANLVASTGAVGRQLLARAHTLPVGSRSVIGQTTANAAPVIALDTGSDVVFRRNELLPRTRSEMAVPLVSAGKVIGALDIQSVVPNAFNKDDVAIFEVIAEQLALIIENARLYQALKETENKLSTLESRIMNEGWRAYVRERSIEGPTGYEMSDTGINPHDGENLPEAMQAAIDRGELIILDEGDDEFSLGIPIMIQDEVIGVFGFGGENIRNLSNDDISLIHSITERIGLALESIRLADEAALRAEQEERINEISSKISLSTNVDYILQTATQEIGRILRAPQTSIQLTREKGRDDD